MCRKSSANASGEMFLREQLKAIQKDLGHETSRRRSHELRDKLRSSALEGSAGEVAAELGRLSVRVASPWRRSHPHLSGMIAELP